MDFNELLLKRESTRNYIDKKVEREKLIQCIEAGRVAPSACNAQPWKFVIVDEETKVNELRKCIYDPTIGINKFLPQAPAFIVAIREKRNLTSKIGEIVKKKDFTSLDMGMAIENICLYATYIGLGTCIMGWFKEKEIRKTLNIPKNKEIDLIISIGYSGDENPRKKVRKDINDIMGVNKY